MFYVYILKSLSFPEQTYVGYTVDLKKRLNEHNEGLSLHTSKYGPWEVVVYLGFKNEYKAIEFEKYLKSGSGTVFRNKKFL